MGVFLKFRCPVCGGARGVRHFGLDPEEDGEVYVGRPAHVVERILLNVGGRGAVAVLERGAVSLAGARALLASMRAAVAALKVEIAEAVSSGDSEDD